MILHLPPFVSVDLQAIREWNPLANCFAYVSLTFITDLRLGVGSSDETSWICPWWWFSFCPFW
ncbi:MAG: hypothetical protein DMF25_00660 [Verrucomicrobia bacterium]|nr:MAG: hypothetical protein DMF25_00660 [Verrucomicrobiota bacterium]